MAVLSTFRAPSLCRHVHHELLRSVLLDVTPKIPATACHQRHDVERYSRYRYRTNITEQQLQGAPKFSGTSWDWEDRARGRQVYDFYGASWRDY
jgi:hypothetical protein